MQSDDSRPEETTEERQFEEYTQYWVSGCEALFDINEEATRRWAEDLKSSVPFSVIFNDLPSDYMVRLIVESHPIDGLDKRSDYEAAYLRIRDAFFAAEKGGALDVDWPWLRKILDTLLAEYGSSLQDIKKCQSWRHHDE